MHGGGGGPEARTKVCVEVVTTNKCKRETSCLRGVPLEFSCMRSRGAPPRRLVSSPPKVPLQVTYFHTRTSHSHIIPLWAGFCRFHVHLSEHHSSIVTHERCVRRRDDGCIIPYSCILGTLISAVCVSVRPSYDAVQISVKMVVKPQNFLRGATAPHPKTRLRGLLPP